MANFVRSVEDLLERNKHHQQSRVPQPLISDMSAMKIKPSQFVVVGCVDPRANPTDIFDLKTGGCMVIRNAGGRANQSIINDILVLDSLMGITDVVLAHHTDCGMTHTTDKDVQSFLKRRLPDHHEIDLLKFGEIKNSEQAVKDDMKYLAESPYLASKDTPIKLHGFIYDIKTGELQKVEE